MFEQMQAGWHVIRHLLRKTRVDRGVFSYPANKAGPNLNLVGRHPIRNRTANGP